MNPGLGRLDEPGQQRERAGDSTGSSGVPVVMSSIRRGYLRASVINSCDATSSDRGPMWMRSSEGFWEIYRDVR